MLSRIFGRDEQEPEVEITHTGCGGCDCNRCPRCGKPYWPGTWFPSYPMQPVWTC